MFKTGPGKSWDVPVISFLLGLTTALFVFLVFYRKAKSYNSHHGHVRDTVVRQIADISSNNVALWQKACWFEHAVACQFGPKLNK